MCWRSFEQGNNGVTRQVGLLDKTKGVQWQGKFWLGVEMETKWKGKG